MRALDYYKILQVDPNAEFEVIRAAYRALAQKYHPDRGIGSDARMAAINGAWNVLRDPVARGKFDRLRSRPEHLRPPGPDISHDPRADARPGNQSSAPGPSGAFDPSTGTPPNEGHVSAPGRGRLPQRESISRTVHELPPTVLDFGRYAGWSIAEIAGFDPDFLEWLGRTPIGRRYRAEIQSVLTSLATASASAARPRSGSGTAAGQRPQRSQRRLFGFG